MQTLPTVPPLQVTIQRLDADTYAAALHRAWADGRPIHDDAMRVQHGVLVPIWRKGMLRCGTFKVQLTPNALTHVTALPVGAVLIQSAHRADWHAGMPR